VNLGNDGINAIKVLRTHPAWPDFIKALRERATTAMNAAIEADTDHTHLACGYARAVRDMYVACESAATNVPQQQVKKPGPKE